MKQTKQNVVIIQTNRDCYSKNEAAERTMTVSELVSLLEGYDEDTPIVLSFDNGYTYGWLKESRIEDDCICEEEEEGVEL